MPKTLSTIFAYKNSALPFLQFVASELALRPSEKKIICFFFKDTLSFSSLVGLLVVSFQMQSGTTTSEQTNGIWEETLV